MELKGPPMKLACSSCQKTLRVRDDLAGRRIKCPSCRTTLTVPALDDLETLEPLVESDELESDEGPISPRRVSRDAAPNAASADTKTCPMCGGQVKAIARKCRFCGEMLEGGGGIDARPGYGIWRDKDRLVMSKDSPLPYVCIKTNQTADAWLRRRLSWHDPWIYLLFLAGILVYAIVALLVRQTADIEVALCRERIVRRRWTIAGAWLSAILGLVMIVGGLATIQPGNSVAGWISLAGLIALLVGPITGAMLARVVTPVRITKEHVWLKGAHPAFLAALPPFPGE
jgi:hypothetical protein